jgi:serine protease Do
MPTLSLRILLTSFAFVMTTLVVAQEPNPLAAAPESRTPDLLRQFNTSLETLVAKVSPAVVQIQVTGVGPLTGSGKSGVAFIARQHAIGSGVIVDPDGYIMTNAHVVEGAQRIRVVLPMPPSHSLADLAPYGWGQVLDAKLVGLHKDTDLALLKVDGHKLPFLRLGTTQPVHTGEIVLAIGSPEGLQSSVTMGVVSSAWRQPDPDQPMVYIQTDAPINPGNSGGPLVNLDGDVIGLNTFILSEGGGSEGLGFAIPARIVGFVYANLRKYGHVHRTEIQVGAQTVTPTLAAGLGLAQNWGVVVSDVIPKGPADAAGLKVQDIVVAIDGRPILGLPGLTAALYLHPADQVVRMDVLRGNQKIALNVPAIEDQEKEDHLADFIDPNNRIGRLGIYVMDLDDQLRSAISADVRIPSGVVVLGQSLDLNALTSTLRAGDIIHAVNRVSIQSVDQLRSALRALKPGDPVVLQIERLGQLQYVDFEME